MTQTLRHPAPFLRHNLDGSHQTSQNASHYLRPAGRPDWRNDTSTPFQRLGTAFPYAGSLTGISATIQVLTHTTTSTIDIEVHQISAGTGAATVVASATSPSLTGTGIFEFSWTQDPGVDTWAAGSDFSRPTFAIYVNFGTFAGSVKVIGTAELTFDAP